MIKTVLICLLVLQVFSDNDGNDFYEMSDDRRGGLRLDFNNDVLLPSFLSTSTAGNIVVKLEEKISSVPITVQLRQISNLADPLTSSLLATQLCTFSWNQCIVTFSGQTLNSASRYVIRLVETTIIHEVEVKISLSVTSSSGFTSTLKSKGHVNLSPEGTKNPGFRFYVATPGTWTANFQLASLPAPTISSYTFSLWSVSNNALTLVSTQSVSAVGSISFPISTAGEYYLSVGLTVTAIDATVRYPISLTFNIPQVTCPINQYFNKLTKTCVNCPTVTYADGTTAFRCKSKSSDDNDYNTNNEIETDDDWNKSNKSDRQNDRKSSSNGGVVRIETGNLRSDSQQGKGKRKN